MSRLSLEDYEQLLTLHGLTRSGERSVPAATASSISAPERVRIDATWTPAPDGDESFAGVQLRAGSSAPWMTAGAHYRVSGVLLPARETHRPTLWPYAIEGLSAGRPIDVARLRLHSYRAEPPDSAETVGTQPWEPAPRTAACDLLVGTHEGTVYILVLRVLDPRYVGDVHYHARRAWRRWFPQPDPPSSFCLLEVDDDDPGHTLGDPIAPFVSRPSLAGRALALRDQLESVINGRHNSIGFAASIVAVAGNEVAVLSAGHRVIRRRGGTEQDIAPWSDPLLYETLQREQREPTAEELRAALGSNVFVPMSAPVTTSLAPGDQWFILGDARAAARGPALIADFIELTHRRGALVGLAQPHLVAVTIGVKRATACAWDTRP